jgi:hypothetical protein
MVDTEVGGDLFSPRVLILLGQRFGFRHRL